MNREIKFRVWRPTNKNMVYSDDYDFAFSDGSVSVSLSGETVIGNATGLMQFTGLKDKNDKEIYEGDIVLADDNKCVVKWDNTQAGFLPFCEQIWNAADTYSEWCIDVVEVIGNIYDNPDLIKSTPHL